MTFQLNDVRKTIVAIDNQIEDTLGETGKIVGVTALVLSAIFVGYKVLVR